MDMFASLTETIPPEMAMLKSRLKAIWMSGDYGHFAQYLEPGAMEFFPQLQVEAGKHVLDVACGAGQLSLPAARAGAKVTGIDIATNLIEQARKKASAENLDVRFEEADAEDLPYEDASFDIVFSLIGAMFAPRPAHVAAELIRVCRPGGRIVMGNWTAEGFVGEMFKASSKYAPPPAGMPSPVLWGNESTVQDRLQHGVAELRMTRKLYPLKYPFPPADVVDFFQAYYGPTNRAFAALEPDKQQQLRDDLESLWTKHNLANDDGTEVRAEYLEVVAVRA